MGSKNSAGQLFSLRSLRRFAGLLLLGLGLLVAIFPFLSVWQLSEQILDELPDNPSWSVVDSENQLGTAIFDEDFVLATRRYEDASLGDVESALADNGFDRSNIGGKLWWTKECCGEYDAVMVDVTDSADGAAEAVVTAFDSDVQATWPIFPVFGFVIGLVGALLLGRRTEPRDSIPKLEDPELQAGSGSAGVRTSV